MSGADAVFGGRQAIVELFGNNSGLAPAAVTLGHVDYNTGSLQSKWSLFHDIPNDGGFLRLSYGPHRDFDNNPVIASFSTNGSLGLGSPSPTEPLAPLHLRDLGPDVSVSATSLDTAVFASDEAVLGLYSSGDGGYGSAVVLKDVEPAGTLGDTWAIARQAAPDSSLRFTYGTEADHTANPTRLTITPDGRLGIGTTSPPAPLSVRTPTNTDSRITLQSGGSWMLGMTQKPDSTFVIGNGGQDRLFLEPNGRLGIGLDNPQYRLELPNVADVSGRARANRWDTYSSARYKANIQTVSDPIGLVSRLRGVSFEWKKEHGSGYDLGFIAEEVAQVFPDLVTLDDSGHPISLDYSRFVPVAIEAIKDQQRQLDQQAEAIDALTARLNSIERLQD